MKWFITFLRGARHPSDCPRIHHGCQVTTRFGEGIVVGGSIRVKYERPPIKNHGENNKEWTHDLREFD